MAQAGREQQGAAPCGKRLAGPGGQIGEHGRIGRDLRMVQRRVVGQPAPAHHRRRKGMAGRRKRVRDEAERFELARPHDVAVPYDGGLVVEVRLEAE